MRIKNAIVILERKIKVTNKPLISIIVSIYNGEKRLNQCIDSLIYQTYENIEIILVDKESTDNSKEIENLYQKQFPNKVKVYHIAYSENAAAGRNYGISVARGNYIAFCDADDWYELNAMEKIAEKIISDKPDIIVYDTYVVSERNAPAGLLPVEDFEVTVSEEGQTLYYILEDKRVFSPVRLVKKDAETGEVIPIAGAEFQLLDQDKNPVTMTVHYPQETVYSAFKTDESGSFVLPDRLPAGIYYFQEKRAPEGYILSKEPVRFEITEDHEWGDPFVAEIADKPAKGRFCIRKTDEETGDAVPGAKFEIRAKEDIRTPAGTLLMAEGSPAGVLATGADGTAESDSLPLGRYEIQEIEQAPGYVLSEEVYEAELKYEDQETEIATVNIEFTNKPTTVILWKTEEGTGGTDGAGGAAGAEGADDVQGTAKGLEGVKFTVWKKEEATQNADGAGEPDHTDPEQEASGWDVPEENIHVTDENGRIILRYLTPGTYCVRETESIPGYLRDDAVWEFTVDQTGKVEGKACVEYRIENKKTQIADTLAFWQESGNKEIYAGEDNVIIDMVSLQNLEAGQLYTLRGMLADPDTG